MSHSATLRTRIVRATMDAANARRTWSERASLLIAVEADGLVGRGEAAPLPGYSRETFDACEAALGALPASALLGPTNAALNMALPPAAEFALYAARREWWAQKRGERLCPTGTRALATLSDDPRHACFKRKVGRDVESELLALSALRSNYPEHRLRIDANGALSVPDARRVDEAAMALDVALFEEPVPYEDLSGLSLGVPVALDESLQHPDAIERARRAFGEGWAHAIVLKPTALGPTRCIQLAALARSLGADVIVSHTYEGRLGHAAACVLALELGTETPQGLGRYPLLENEPSPDEGLCANGRLDAFDGHRYPVELPPQ